MLLYVPCSKKRILQLCGIVTLSIFLIIRFWPRSQELNQWHLPFPVSKVEQTNIRSPQPQRSTGFDNVQVIVKTGTAELKNKLPTFLRTVLSPVPKSSLLIFSDAPTTAESHEILDALEGLSDKYKSRHPEFVMYREQKDSLAGGRHFDGKHEGWKLDKHKFIPMVSKTWYLQPNKDFYFFIELDTFVYWNTILEFLATLDPSKPLYLGAPVDPVPFAYGGAGFVLSRGAMKKLFRNEASFGGPGMHQLGHDLSDACCGDALLADALLKAGIGIKGYWPMFSGDNPSIIAFGGPDGYWCEPFGTLHHVGPEEIDSLWNWTQSRTGAQKILRYADFFSYAYPKISDTHGRYWNHETIYAKHVQRLEKVKTLQACRMSCEKRTGCFRYQFQNQICEISFSMQIGRSLADNEVHDYHAYAKTARIEEFWANSFCNDPPFNPGPKASKRGSGSKSYE